MRAVTCCSAASNAAAVPARAGSATDQCSVRRVIGEGSERLVGDIAHSDHEVGVLADRLDGAGASGPQVETRSRGRSDRLGPHRRRGMGAGARGGHLVPGVPHGRSELRAC